MKGGLNCKTQKGLRVTTEGLRWSDHPVQRPTVRDEVPDLCQRSLI